MKTLFSLVFQQKMTLVGLAMLGIFIGGALLAPWIAPHPPEQLYEPLRPPSSQHPLGTDDVGHDLLSELIYGARASLSISLVAALASTLIGLWLGTIAGYSEGQPGNYVGFMIMRVVDILMVIPRFPLIVLMSAFLQPGAGTLILFFTLFGWPRAARLARAQILSERTKDYVQAARLIGASDRRILIRHLMPSVLPIALTRFVIEFQHVILAESGLSFLGLGNPMVKSWGMMLSYAFRYPTIFITNLWVRWIVPPGMCITLVVLALTFLSFSLDIWANPRLKTWSARGITLTTHKPRIEREQATGFAPRTKPFRPLPRT